MAPEPAANVDWLRCLMLVVAAGPGVFDALHDLLAAGNADRIPF